MNRSTENKVYRVRWYPRGDHFAPRTTDISATGPSHAEILLGHRAEAQFADLVILSTRKLPARASEAQRVASP